MGGSTALQARRFGVGVLLFHGDPRSLSATGTDYCRCRYAWRTCRSYQAIKPEQIKTQESAQLWRGDHHVVPRWSTLKTGFRMLAKRGASIVLDLRGSRDSERKIVTHLGMQHVAMPLGVPFPKTKCSRSFLRSCGRIQQKDFRPLPSA